MTPKKILVFASISGLLCVCLGALGAHAFKDKLEVTLPTYEKAVLYQLFHTLALFVLFIISLKFSDKKFLYTGWFWIAGIILFSGSLYCYSLIKGSHNENFNWLVHITPFGGMSFMIGWLMLFLGAMKIKP